MAKTIGGRRLRAGGRRKGLRRSLELMSLLTMLLVLAACGSQTPEAEGLSTQAAAKTFYVATNGKDSNSGTVSTAPLATISNAIRKAQSSRSQGTVDVIVAAGTYRQAVEVNDASTGSLITVKGPGAVISGSDIYPKANWESRGNGVWRHRWYKNWPTTSDDYTPAMAKRRECVFNSGQLLEQVNSGAALTQNNTFKVEEGEDYLYIKVSTFGTVEVCVRPTLWSLSGTRNLLVKDLTFQHAASTWKEAAVLARSDQTYDGITARFNGQAGLHLLSNDSAVLSRPMSDCVHNHASCDIMVRNSKFNENGFSGIVGYQIKDSMVTFSEASKNNWRGAWAEHYTWDTGNKVLGVRNLIVSYNKFMDNESNGWWCDTDCAEIDFYGNIVTGNRENGIMVELSQGPFKIHDNTFNDNGKADVLCSTVDGCMVYDNKNKVQDGKSYTFEVLQVINTARCIITTNDQNNYYCSDKDRNSDTRSYWDNPFNMEQNYYPHSTGFDVHGNDYKQVFFQATSKGKLEHTRDTAVSWTGNDYNEAGTDKVKIVEQNGNTITRSVTMSEQQFRNDPSYTWPGFTWLAFD